MITWGELSKQVPGLTLTGNLGDFSLHHVFLNSREVLPQSLFAALPGARSHGIAFFPQARAQGAIAVITDSEGARAFSRMDFSGEIPCVVSSDLRRHVAQVCRAVYATDQLGLRHIGITGTNGKTSTAFAVQAMLRHAHYAPAMVGTLGLFAPGVDFPSAHTTPEADTLARFFMTAHAQGATHCVSEVSSHALALHRIDGVDFEVAAFTNLTRDHLDFHGTMQAYGEAKARLFGALSPKCKVIHIGDAFGHQLALSHQRSGMLIACWVADRNGSLPADIDSQSVLCACPVASDDAGLTADVSWRGQTTRLQSPLTGRHNLENLLVAIGIGLALDMPLEQAVLGVGSLTHVPGRLHAIKAPDGAQGFVDYAHTPDALERVLHALRPHTKGKLWVVFGCGGDRDPGKRRQMGDIAARLADHIVVTNDNPRSEDPLQIAAAIVEGIGVDGYKVILDRHLAIEHAALHMAPNDVLLVAGKGHETYQIIADQNLPFDDYQQLSQAFLNRG